MMNETVKQQLSSIMDGEADGGSDLAVTQLMASAHLKSTWRRYQLISDVMNGNLPRVLDKNLAGKLAEKIAREPAILAARRNWAAHFLRPVAGMAIAASVAAIAILGIQQSTITPAGGQNLQADADMLTEISVGVSRRYTFPASSSVVTTKPVVADSVAESGGAVPIARMNSYLVNYNEARVSQTGVQGINPYARIIANDNDN